MRKIFWIMLCIPLLTFAQKGVNLERGLLIHLPFNTAEAKDIGPYHHPAQITGATWEEDARCGDPAYFFDGKDDFIDFGNADELNGDFNGLTISVWVKATDVQPRDFGLIVGKWAFDEEKDQFGLFLSNKRKISFSIGDGEKFGYGVYTNTRIQNHEWYHIVAVWNKSTKVGLFVNGRMDLIGKQHGNGINAKSPISLKLGRQNVGQERPFKGYVDQVRVYNRSLSIQEIKHLYMIESLVCRRVYLEGRVIDVQTKKPISTPILIDGLNSKFEYETVKSEPGTGKYKATLPIGFKFGLHVNEAGYNPKNDSVRTGRLRNNTIIKKDLLLLREGVDTTKMMIEGVVLDIHTKKPVEAEIAFEDLESGGEVIRVVTEKSTGYYKAGLPPNFNLGFYAKADGYISVNENINTSGYTSSDTIRKDLLLVPLNIGEIVRLNNIFFDTDKAILRSESFSELYRLQQLLEEVPTLIIEISGHTDNVGSDTYNEDLSQRRANAVMNHIISQGIDPERITAKGYGESKPVDTNATAEGKQNNRRVEFKIIAK